VTHEQPPIDSYRFYVFFTIFLVGPESKKACTPDETWTWDERTSTSILKNGRDRLLD
jgi:hypothetical protein